MRESQGGPVVFGHENRSSIFVTTAKVSGVVSSRVIWIFGGVAAIWVDEEADDAVERN